jgi:hypothetical protein
LGRNAIYLWGEQEKEITLLDYACIPIYRKKKKRGKGKGENRGLTIL